MNPDKKQNLKTGKRGELLVMQRLLTEGFDIYTPLVDDHGVDAIVRLGDGPFLQLQVKTTGADAQYPASFQPGTLPEKGEVFFIFHSEGWDTTWIMSTGDIRAHRVKSGYVDFYREENGKQVPKPELNKFKAGNFDRLKRES